MDVYTNNNIEYPYSLVTHNIRVSVRTNFLNDQSDEDNNLWVWSYSILIEVLLWQIKIVYVGNFYVFASRYLK